MAYAGHPLVGDPLYVRGGVPASVPAAQPATAEASDATLVGSGGGGDGDGCSGDGLGGGGEGVGRGEEEAAAAAAAAGTVAGTVAVPGDCGYVLHAMRIRFEHPVTGLRLLVEALPIPEVLQTPAERSSGVQILD